MIELRGISAGYDGRDVLHDITLSFAPGKLMVLLGPNGCGKSTLLRVAAGLLPGSGGEVLLDGTPMDGCSAKHIARHVAWLSQSRPVPNISVRQLVLHGRFPWLGWPRHYRKEDYEAVDHALSLTGASDWADCELTRLSGGQQQRVYLAMVLAQGAQTLLLDEPTTFLDVRHQLDTMELVRKLAAQGKAVVLVLHDLCLALQYADELAVLEQGKLAGFGPPEEIYACGVLNRAMAVSLRRIETPYGPRYYFA